MLFGFCPACNSQAPALYDCKVCHYDTHTPQWNKVWWPRFLARLHND
jgi:hypothetical protein